MDRPSRTQIQMRLARHYVEVCDQAAGLIREGRGLSEIAKDVSNILIFQRAVADLTDSSPEASELCWQFPFAIGVAGASLVGWKQLIEWNEQGVAAARGAPLVEARTKIELQLCANLGYLYSASGDLPRSRDLYYAAYCSAAGLRQPLRLGELAGHLGEVLCELEKYDLASEFLEQSKDYAVGASPRQKAVAEFRLGRLYRLRGQFEIAATFLQIAADIAEAATLDDLQLMVLGEFAAMCDDARFYPAAISLYNQILKAGDGGSDPNLEGRLTAALADACFHANDLVAARTYYGKAIAVFGKTGDRVSDGRTLSGIGAVLAAQGSFSDALGHFRRSLEIALECGDTEGCKKVLLNLTALRSILAKEENATLVVEIDGILDNGSLPLELLPRALIRN